MDRKVLTAWLRIAAVCQRLADGLQSSGLLQVASQISDAVEGSVVVCVDQRLQLGARTHAGGVGVADWAGVKGRHHRGGPGGGVCDIRHVRAEIIAECPHAPDELGGLVELVERLIAAHRGLHGRQRRDQRAGAADGPSDLVPHLASASANWLSTVGQLVQVASVVVDHAGGFVEFAADFARLIRHLGLFQRFSVGPGQAPHHRDIGQLGLPAAPSARGRQGRPASASRVGDLMKSTIGVIEFCGKWRSIASYPCDAGDVIRQ